jgi:hypothetical protein
MAEARAAAHTLGIAADKVLFLGQADGECRCDANSVGALRKLLLDSATNPDLVFTHTPADSHNDHRATHEITLATFRGKVILSFAVINSLIESRFEPRLFSDITPSLSLKEAALACHVSQRERIKTAEIEQHAHRLGRTLGLEFVEGFELLVQEGGTQYIPLLNELNACPFNAFWTALIDGDPLVLIHAVPVHRKEKDGGWQTDMDREGINTLRDAFGRMWHGKQPIEDHSSTVPEVERLLERSHVLLSGGAVSNEITRTHFNHFRGIRYVIGFAMPGFRDIHVRDLATDTRIFADYETDRFGARRLLRDRGILTIMRNPHASERTLIGCMGIHGYGTMACFRVLSDRLLLRNLLTLVPVPLRTDGYQVLVSYDVRNDEILIEHESLQVIG